MVKICLWKSRSLNHFVPRCFIRRCRWCAPWILNSLQVVSPKNGGKHLDPIKFGKVKQPNSISRICSSRVRCGFKTAGLISEPHFITSITRWWSEVPKSKQRPLLSTTTTVGGCSILKRVPARTRPLNTFRTCVSKSSKASFSTMKRQNMNKRTKELAPWRQHFSKGSCCFPLQLRISSQAAIMAIENAIVAMAMHTLSYSTFPYFRQQGPAQGSKTCVCGSAWCCVKRLTLHLFASVATRTDSVSSKWPRAAPPLTIHRMAFELLSSWAAAQLNKPEQTF